MSGAGEKALEVADVRFRYAKGAAPTLDGVSLALEAGAFAALIGPNGAGKTTLLRLCAGSLAPESGAIRVSGQDLAGLDRLDRARRLALVPQESVPPFRFRAIDLVLVGRTPYRSGFSFDGPEDIEEARRALRLAGAEAFATRALAELSGGERQRVAVARALAQRAPVVLLDEPTTYLDVRHRLALFESLARLAREERMTILTVSHDMGLAAQFCDPVIVLEAGRVRAAGTPKEVVTEALLREVFGVAAVVVEHPKTGAPVPMPWEAN